MKLTIRLKILSLCILFISMAGCKPNAEKKINEGIKLFNSGDSLNSVKLIEEGLINSSLLKKSGTSNLSFGDGILFYRFGNYIQTIWPVDMKIEIDKSYNKVCRDSVTGKIGLSNGNDIKIYNPEGALIKTCCTITDGKQIRAFMLLNEDIIYYKDKNIFIYNLSAENEALLINDKNLKPAGNEINDIRFSKAGDILMIITGVAGKYNINAFDLQSNTTVLQITNAASSKIFVNADTIYYMSGNAGKYFVSKTEMPAGKQKEIIEFENLRDIELFFSYALYEDKDGLWSADYLTGSKQKIPFKFKLSGQCGGNLVLHYLNEFYVIETAAFLDKINAIREKAPAVFDIQEDNFQL